MRCARSWCSKALSPVAWKSSLPSHSVRRVQTGERSSPGINLAGFFRSALGTSAHERASRKSDRAQSLNGGVVLSPQDAVHLASALPWRTGWRVSTPSTAACLLDKVFTLQAISHVVMPTEEPSELVHTPEGHDLQSQSDKFVSCLPA